jgi:hypothetical protein
MYIYLKYSIYKNNMRLAAICIKYYTADHPPLNISCNFYFKIKKYKCGGYFLMQVLMRNREFFLLGLRDRSLFMEGGEGNFFFPKFLKLKAPP